MAGASRSMRSVPWLLLSVLLLLTATAVVLGVRESPAVPGNDPIASRALALAISRTESSSSLVESMTRTTPRVTYYYVVSIAGPDDWYTAQFNSTAPGQKFEMWGVGHNIYESAAGLFGPTATKAEVSRAISRLRGSYAVTPRLPTSSVIEQEPQDFAVLRTIQGNLNHLAVSRHGSGYLMSSLWPRAHTQLSGSVETENGRVTSAELHFGQTADRVSYSEIDSVARIYPPAASQLVAVDPTTGCVEEITYLCVIP